MTTPTHTIVSPECLPCPWCGSEQSGEYPVDDGPAVPAVDGPGPYDCTACHKSFRFDIDDTGAFLTVGIVTKADEAYLAWKAAKDARLSLQTEGK